MKTKLTFILIFTILGLLTLGLLGSGCTSNPDLDRRLNEIVNPYRFSLVLWESRVIPHELNQQVATIFNRVDNEVPVVTEYFSITKRIRTLNSQIRAINAGSSQGDLATLEAERDTLKTRKTALNNTVERVIERQVKETLAEQDIYSPVSSFAWLKVNFPPVNFKLENPPHLLVVSPRDRIESIREIILEQEINLGEMEAIEDEVDSLGVSSLVVKLGGLGSTYPSFVTDEANLRFTLAAAAEEWIHQYLFFKPLGILYTLDLTGISRNYEIATINETVASMVSNEIADTIFQKYYSQDSARQNEVGESGFDFNREMREIREKVDEYLAAGEIEAAEEFMEERRQHLAANGYYIRKLNQAYFAFYGVYADDPTSISPIGVELRQLREQSVSLKEFLDITAVLTSRQDIIDGLR